MDPLSGDRHVQAFRATDALAIEAWRALRDRVRSGHGAVAEGLRQATVRGGAALVVAASVRPGGAEERAWLNRCHQALAEARYYVYLARRFGLLDSRTYRGLIARQEAALRQVTALLGSAAARPGATASATRRVHEGTTRTG